MKLTVKLSGLLLSLFLGKFDCVLLVYCRGLVGLAIPHHPILDAVPIVNSIRLAVDRESGDCIARCGIYSGSFVW